MSCMHQYESRVFRTYGANIPDSCQGAFFPGDGPGERCRITNDLCEDLEGNEPCMCAGAKKKSWYCPVCRDQARAAVYESGHGVLFCSECHTTWKNEEELFLAINERLGECLDEIDDLDFEVKKLQRKYASLVAPLRRFYGGLDQETLDEIIS